MRILVISDNEDIGGFIVEFLSQQKLYGACSVELRYSWRNRHPERMARLGATGIDLRDGKVVADLLSRFDLVVSAHCKQLFPASLVNGLRCVNLHPGLNPFNRGWFPQVFSIINGLPAGATLHEMDEEIDHGAVIDQAEVEVLPWDTSGSVYQKVLEAEKEIFVRSAPFLLGIESCPRANVDKGNYNSIEDFRQLCKLDLDHVGTLREHLALLRALSHPPYWNAEARDRGRTIWFRLETRADRSDTPT